MKAVNGFRPWRELTILNLMIMEVSWVTPWFRSLSPTTYAAPLYRVFTILFGLMLFAHLCARGLTFLRLKIIYRQIFIALFLGVSVFIGFRYLIYTHENVVLAELINRPLRSLADWRSLIPDEFLIGAAIIFAWWRGISLAQTQIGPHYTASRFGLGVIMFILFALLNTLVTGETPGNLLYVFLFSSLLAMSSARFAILHGLRGGKTTTFEQRWLAGSLVVAGALTIFAAWISNLAGLQAGLIGQIFLLLTGLLILLLWLLISPLLILAIWVVEQLPGAAQAAEHLATQFQILEEQMARVISHLYEFLERTGIAQAIAQLAPGFKLIVLLTLLSVLGLGVLIWAAYNTWHDRSYHYLGEEQTSLFNPIGLLMVLRDLFLRQAKRATSLLEYKEKREKLRAADHIRAIYTRLMELCKQLGHARRQAQTPLEFLPLLQDIFSEQGQDLALITRAYLDVRYGQLLENRGELEQVEKAWRRVEAAGKELLVEKAKH